MRPAKKLLDQIEVGCLQTSYPPFQQSHRHRFELEDRWLPESLHELQEGVAIDFWMFGEKAACYRAQRFCGHTDEFEVALQIRLRACRALLVADSPKLPAQLLGIELGTQSTPSCLPTFSNAATARSRCSRSWAAEIWTRILASPLGTTGKEKPMT